VIKGSSYDKLDHLSAVTSSCGGHADSLDITLTQVSIKLHHLPRNSVTSDLLLQFIYLMILDICKLLVLENTAVMGQ